MNTYNPTVHALVESLLEASSQITPHKKVGDGCSSRSIIIGGRSNKTGKGYVQYEIFGGGSGGRSGKDGVSGTNVNQSNAKIAPIEIIESEFATRVRRFELIPDSGGPAPFAAAWASCASTKCSTTTRAFRCARPNTPSRPRASTAAATARPATAC